MDDCNESYMQNFLKFTIGNLFGKDITCREPVYPCDDYQPGSLVDFGRTVVKLFKKFLIPGGLCGAVPAIRPVPTSPDKPVECNNEMNLIRPSQLPIYTYDTTSCTTEHVTCYDDENPPSFLEQGFKTVRRSIQGAMKEYDDTIENINNKITTGIVHSQSMVDYLREESNTLPRIGAVIIGGLTGFIFGLRGGKFKKYFYTVTGTTIVAAVCYPNEAKQSLTASKYYINILYNFIYGVKPGDENQLEVTWPEFSTLKIPQSFSELINLVQRTGAKSTRAIESLIENKSEAKPFTENEGKLEDNSKSKSY